MKADPKLIGELLGLFAHDLRNPLSALQSNASFLEMTEGVDSDALEAISDLLVACDGLAHIIDNLDVLARDLKETTEAGGRPLSVAALVAEVVERSKRAASSHGVEVQVEISPELGKLELQNASDGLPKALGNLLRNSLQHAPHGTGVLIRAEERGAGVCISVIDSGTPVSQDSADVVFSLAGQIKVKTSGAGRYGRGLGLYAARSSAELSGAGISIGAGPKNCFELLCKRRVA